MPMFYGSVEYALSSVEGHTSPRYCVKLTGFFK